MTRTKDIPVEKRLMDSVVIDEHGCWLWQKSKYWTGYGRFCYQSRPRAAHRWSYEIFVGPVPDGLDLDHLCRVRNCINPAHLEICTRRENLMRGRHPNMVLARAKKCKKGHDVDEGNCYYRSDGRMMCKICFKAYQKKRYEKKKPSGTDDG